MPRAKPVTNNDLALAIKALDAKLSTRLDKMEGTIKKSGLNGHTQLLSEFLDAYSSERTQKEAYASVRKDLLKHLKWLAVPSGWFKIFGAALIGGGAWAIVSEAISGHWWTKLPPPF
jgi:hypothetical protein